MGCQSCWKKLLPLSLTLMIGLSVTYLFQEEYGNQESGSRLEMSAPVKPTSKPSTNYTDAARQNQVQGTVTLRVTFLADGSIGDIAAVKSLPDGLTEQAIAAAKEIKFEPARRDGVPVTVTKKVQYNFYLY